MVTEALTGSDRKLAFLGLSPLYPQKPRTVRFLGLVHIHTAHAFKVSFYPRIAFKE